MEGQTYYQGKACLETIEKVVGTEGVKAFCKANAIKYLFRAGKKEGNSEEKDIKKAISYLEYYVEFLKKENEEKIE